MNIKLTAFGIAKDIIGARSTNLSIDPDATIGQLKQQLIESHPDFEHLVQLNFAVDETYQDDNYQLQHLDEVVIIPPVSGG